jgi:hypothetical protein
VGGKAKSIDLNSNLWLNLDMVKVKVKGMDVYLNIMRLETCGSTGDMFKK